MKKLTLTLAATAALAFSGSLFALNEANAGPGSESLDDLTAGRIVYLHDQAKLALDLNWEFLEQWDDPVFLSLGALERRHMDELLSLMTDYGLEPLVNTGTEGEYGIDEHTEAYFKLHALGWSSLYEAYRGTAYVEEWDITLMRTLLASSTEPTVVATVSKLLAGAEDHLRSLVSRVEGLGVPYSAQMLDSSDVEEICRGVEPYAGTDFVLDGTLNDAWYYPFTQGQGLFVSVYPVSKTVLVTWMTYDTVLPGENAESFLGDAGQRWLIAQGPYEGNRAELGVYSAHGGLFDDAAPPKLDYIGFMKLQFDDCSTGSIMFVLMPLFGGTFLPIERVAADNIALCEDRLQSQAGEGLGAPY